jgi:hypothetical protein
MKALKILVVLTAIVVIAGLTADVWAANCIPGRQFRSLGKPTTDTNNVRIGVDGSGADNTTHMIGRIWDSDDANNANTGLTDLNGDGTGFGTFCPVLNFYQVAGTADRKIDEFMGSTTCIGNGCPALNMTVLVEDYAAGGPPGVGQTAYYTAWMVKETPGAVSGRWYDFGLVDGVSGVTTIPLLAFPDVAITGSSRAGANVSINYNNLDQTNMVHTWNINQVYPTNAVIKEWQLVKATGSADPGRLRSLGWVTIQSTPYVPGGAPASFVVPCSSTVTDEFVAIGIGFNGGTAGTIDSALVGRAIPLECDPNIAQPDLPVNVDRKPSATQLDGNSGRSGGRR